MTKIKVRRELDRSQFGIARALLRKEVLVGGLVGAATGAYLGHRNGVKDLRNAEGYYNFAKKINYEGLVAGAIDRLEAPFISEECKATGLPSEYQNECRRMYMKLLQNTFGVGVGSAEASIVNARRKVTEKTLIGSGIGIVPGIFAAFIFARAWKRMLKYASPVPSKPCRVNNVQQNNGEGKDIHSEIAMGPEKGGLGMLSQSGRWKTGEIELDEETRKLRRAAKEKEVELVIRGACGKYSRELAFALVAVLSHRQTQLLLEEPANLRRVLNEYREPIETALKTYGRSLNEIQDEMRKRLEASTAQN